MGRIWSCRVVLCAAAGGVLFAANSLKAAVNLLDDPSFETPSAANGDVPMSSQGSSDVGQWQGWNNWVSPYSAYYTAAVPAEDGSQAAKTFSGPNAGVYQVSPIAVVPGETYTATGWFYNWAGDQVTDTAVTEDLRLIFNDPNSTLATSNEFTPANTVGTWTEETVSAVAPVGATTVEVMAFMNNPNSSGGSMFFDNADLTATPAPEPASLGLLSVAGLALLRRRRQD